MLDVLCFVVVVQFFHWLSGKESTCNAEATGDRRVWSLGREDFLEEEMAIHSSILAWRIPMDRRAWWVTVHGVAKSWTRLKQLTGLISFSVQGTLKSLLQHHNSKASVLWCMVQLSHPYMTIGKITDLTTAKCSQILL